MTSFRPSPAPHAISFGAMFPAVLTGSFGISVGIWSLWFITHLPWLGLSERVSLPTLLVGWFLGSTLYAGRVFQGRLLPSTILGFTTALIGLLLVGSKLTQEPASGQSIAGDLRPHAALIAGAYLVLGGAIGALASLTARFLPGAMSPRGEVPAEISNGDWLSRFAVVTVVGTFPLLLIGGLVTSTNSGMAVLDWPGTFGSNMFLYPLGPRAAPGVYLEHAHRLFGTFAGLCVVTLTILTLLHEPRRWVKAFALGVLAIVILQGVLGGMRVLADTRFYGLMHGVLGQVFFAMAVAFAAVVSRSARLGDGPSLAKSTPAARRVRVFAAAAMHTTLLQLVFGAMYRHLREGKGGGHALMTHMALSVVVVVVAIMAASAASGLRAHSGDPLARALSRAGRLVFVVVTLQFLLGWVTWMLGGKAHDPEFVWQALLRTAHQANGAFLLALVTWMAMLGKGIPKNATSRV